MKKANTYLSAENFFVIAQNSDQDTEKIVNKIMTFLNDNAEIIVTNYNKDKKKGPKSAATFIEYFLRRIFELLINSHISDALYIHKLFIKKDYYFHSKYKEIGYMIRSSASIEYGNYYCYNHNTKSRFKNQYVDEVSKLVESNNIILKMMAFHFISNSLIDDREQYEFVDDDFIPLLEKLYYDEGLKDFCANEQRKEFF